MAEHFTSSSLPANEAPRAIETRITNVGGDLARTFTTVLAAIPGAPHGPQNLAKKLGLDKVLTSRLLKAARSKDPLAVAHLVPGPEPLRRLLRAAAKHGVSTALIRQAEAAVWEFEELIRREAGDRSALDAIISSWLPEARREFEVRRKQSAFKAMSQLKGAMAEVNLATVILHPSDDGVHLDIVWLFGLLGLQRLRPGVPVKFATRRMAAEPRPRHPATLEGEPVQGMSGVRLDRFCNAPPAQLNVKNVGEVVQYTLAGDAFGPTSAADLVLAEVNLREMPRYVPRAEKRKGNVFSEIGTPVKVLQFDVLLQEDVYRGSEPELYIYDTALDGVANINDRARDIDRMDFSERIEPLGRGTAKFRSSEVPNYAQMVQHTFAKMNWDGENFRGYRCRIEYPIYGSQIAIAFDPPEPPGSPEPAAV